MEVPEAIQEATESEEKYISMAPDIISFVFHNQEYDSLNLERVPKSSTRISRR